MTGKGFRAPLTGSLQTSLNPFILRILVQTKYAVHTPQAWRIRFLSIVRNDNGGCIREAGSIRPPGRLLSHPVTDGHLYSNTPIS